MSLENCTSSIVTIIIPFCLCVIWCTKQSDCILFLRACVSSFVDLGKRGALTLVGKIQQHTMKILIVDIIIY